MSECTKRGCRKLKTVCEDCDRTVSTADFKEDKDGYRDFSNLIPHQDEPCEYKITVICRGWYRPNGDEPRFAPDERVLPQSHFSGWKTWKEGPTFDEGVKLVREFREEMMKKGESDEQ